MNTSTFQAQTAYGVAIPKALHSRQEAMTWAQENGDKFPGCRIVMKTETWSRTIWKHVAPEAQREAA